MSEVVLVGANPGLTLFTKQDQREAYASIWHVEWSVMGAGTALLLWMGGNLRIVGTNPELGNWLWEEFVRYFPENDGLEYEGTEIVETPVLIDGTMSEGVQARAADVTVTVSEPLDRRLVQLPNFQLGLTTLGLTTVISPCNDGSVSIDGRPVAGQPKVRNGGTPSSTAFLANAEVWSR